MLVQLEFSTTGWFWWMDRSGACQGACAANSVPAERQSRKVAPISRPAPPNL